MSFKKNDYKLGVRENSKFKDTDEKIFRITSAFSDEMEYMMLKLGLSQRDIMNMALVLFRMAIDAKSIIIDNKNVNIKNSGASELKHVG